MAQLQTTAITGSLTVSSVVSASAVTASLYGTASYISATGLPSGLVSSSGQISYTGLTNTPSGIISSSTQVITALPANTISSSTQFKTLTDPFTGSFTGSHTGTFPYSGLTSVPTLWSSSAQLPSGTVSSSGQVSYTGLTNIPVGIVSSSTQVTTLLPTGTVSSSTQVITALPVNTISSSTQFKTLTDPFTGSFTGSHTGTFPYSGLTSVPTLWSSSAQLPAGTVSSSGQVSYTGLSNIPSGIVSASTQFTSLTAPFTGSFTGSFTGTLPYSNLTSVPTLWSSSAQLPAGTVSSSGQVSYTGLTNIPSGIVSSSTQFTSITAPFTGSFTGSFKGDGTGITGITAAVPTGTVSSSTQFTSLTAPFTGSFTGSFKGDGSQLTGVGTATVPSGTVSSSAQVVANIAGQTITPAVVSSSGNVTVGGTLGVGVTATTQAITVVKGTQVSSAGFYTKFLFSADDLVANDLELLAPSASQGRIKFSNATFAGDGELGYNHNARSMRIVAGSNATFTVTATGITVSGTVSAAGNITAVTDGVYDIGANGATRFRDFYLSRNATISGTLSTGATTISTSGITGLTVLDDTTATQYIKTTNSAGYSQLYFQNTGGTAQTWLLVAGGGTSTFPQQFLIQDTTAATTPFKITGGANPVINIVATINIAGATSGSSFTGSFAGRGAGLTDVPTLGEAFVLTQVFL